MVDAAKIVKTIDDSKLASLSPNLGVNHAGPLGLNRVGPSTLQTDDR